jgi:hypothetical protein
MDPLKPTEAHADPAYRFKPDMMAWGVPLLIGVFALVAALVGWAINPERFYFSYLVAWVFCLSITLGALFFVLAHHITKAHWGVVVRRIPESLAWAFPLLALLSIPILIGMHDLFHWTHEEIYTVGSAGYDRIIAGKRPYLNVPFWLLRLALYFAVWTYMSYRLYRLSLRQDVNPDPAIPAEQRKVSAWGIPVYAVTVAFASYDLLMSLDPHWFSTIFGVYFFAGCYWSAIALMILVSATMQRNGSTLHGVVTAEHYQDLGKWLFAFTIFWAYIAFSQYMLIWYGNLPEETIWYRHRFEHGWGWHSAMLLIGHFVVPFIVLLPRASKRLLPVLSFMAVWALIMHWFDLHWLSMPVYDSLYAEAAGHAAETAVHAGEQALAAPAHHGNTAGFHWLDFACWFGLFGVYLGTAIYRLTRHSVVPRNDPRLGLSLHFHNS